SVDKAEDAFSGRQARLELAPERGKVRDREPETVHSGDEEIPGSDGDRAGHGASTAEVQEHGRSQTGQSVERGEDIGQHKRAPDVDAVGLVIDGHELTIDG